MAKKIIHLDLSRIGNLCCDNPRCGHILPTPIAFNERAIGTLCPRCDSNLLTRRDYEATQRVFKWIERINSFFAFFGIGSEEPPKPTDKDYHSGTVRIHDGKLIVKEKKGE